MKYLALLEINKNYKTVKKKIISAKSFLGPLAPRRSWRQVVSNYSQCEDVLQDKKVASSQSCQNVMYVITD